MRPPRKTCVSAARLGTDGGTEVNCDGVHALSACRAQTVASALAETGALREGTTWVDTTSGVRAARQMITMKTTILGGTTIIMTMPLSW